MYTLHHGFWIYFFTRRHPKVWQFVFGAMLPDYVYIVLLGFLLCKGFVGWSDLAHLSPGLWMSLVPLFPWVVKLDLWGHSVLIWFSAFLISFFPGIKNIRAIIVGWGTHLLFDALTHSAYSNFYLFPLSFHTVESPVSYWEENYWSQEFRMINMLLMAAATAYMLWEWWKTRKKKRK
ncbi:zinc dependent phospholipase C family protein [Sporomusa acidovorans]|uniref:Phospholipase C/D domain-containing protein n=1 Tax=Sporomusa acidovorans (strain ATCC 49682 / DSM 3132 / Mol) TaxID=1123286 RepID=A0ABZ3IXA3_SPOA4|nr:zinc dependent phospholipase C family protein [Sporomusa acidovorans]OZC13867.1 hypothetical protein SPACI_54630 [Sporomusa acidovorans DSM 3132]SDF48440.1 Zinc dependent phospholipase C [Sporomusa acidovorans]